MPIKNSAKYNKKKLKLLETEKEVIQIDPYKDARPDHRDRPDSQYSEEFKKRVARAASVEGAKLTWVGLRFNVLPELVKNWRNQYH